MISPFQSLVTRLSAVFGRIGPRARQRWGVSAIWYCKAGALYGTVHPAHLLYHMAVQGHPCIGEHQYLLLIAPYKTTQKSNI